MNQQISIQAIQDYIALLDAKQNYSPWCIFWQVAKLTLAEHQITLTPNAHETLLAIANFYDLSLPDFTPEDSERLNSAVVDARNDDVNFLVAQVFHVSQGKMNSIPTLALSLWMAEALDQQLNPYLRRDGNKSSVAAYTDYALVPALLACMKGFDVQFYTANHALYAWVQWLSPIFESVFSVQLVDSAYKEVNELATADGLLLCPVMGNKTFDSPLTYVQLMKKFPVIVSYHAQSFFVRQGKIAEERYMAFNHHKQTPIQTLIALPSKSLMHSNLQMQMMVIDNQSLSDSVLMCDLSSYKTLHTEAASDISLWLASILSNQFEGTLRIPFSQLIDEPDFNLSVSSYLMGDALLALKQNNHDVRELGDLVEFMKTRAYQRRNTEKSDEHVEAFYEISVGDIDDFGQIANPTKVSYVTEREASLLKKGFTVSPSDVLISVKGVLGRILLMPEYIPDCWLPSLQLTVMRVKDTSLLSSEYLYYYLNSPAIQAYIQSKNAGTTVPLLRLDDVKRIPVVMPTAEQRLAISENHQRKMQCLSQIMALKTEYQSLHQSLVKTTTHDRQNQD